MRRVRQVKRPVLTQPADYQTQKVVKPKIKRTRVHSKPWLKWSVLAGILIVVGWLGLVRQIDVRGADQPARITSLVEEAIAQPFWYRHLLWTPTAELADELASQNPELIAKITISKNWLSQAIIVDVEERHAVIAWRSGAGEYGVDQKGFLTTQPEGKPLPVVIDNTNLDVKIGQPVAGPRFVKFVLDLPSGLDSAGLKFKQVRLLESTSELYAYTAAGYYLRFDTTRSLADQLKALLALLKENIKPSHYIDLRLPHKAYYR